MKTLTALAITVGLFLGTVTRSDYAPSYALAHGEGEPREATACFVWALTQPCVEVPAVMAERLWEVIQCESTFNPAAVNAASGATGLLQIMPIHRRRIEALGYTWGDMKDGAANIAVGVSIWEEQQWRPWECSRKFR